MRKSSEFSRRGAFLSLPVWVVVLACSGAPLVWLCFQLATRPAVLVDAWPDGFRLRLLGRTLLFNGCAALIAGGLGLPVGIVLGRGRGILAKVLWVALPVTLLLPSLTYAYGWSQFFRLIRVHFEPAGAGDVMRCIWSLATWLWPVPAAAVGISLRRMDVQLQLQALLDGALWRVTLRELAIPLAAGVAIAAVLAAQEFAVYEPTGISVIATEVRMVFETGAFSSPDNPITAPMTGMGVDNASPDGIAGQHVRAANALAVSLPLLFVIGLVAGPVIWLARRSPGAEEIDVGGWPRVLDAGSFAKTQAMFVIVLAVAVPTVSMLLSLHVWRSPLEVWGEFSPQVLGSIAIASMASLVGLGLAFWGTVKQAPWMLALALVTFLLGGQLIAIAQIYMYNRNAFAWIYNAPPIMVGAYVSRFGWLALAAGRTTWSPHWRGLRDLSAVDGAGPVRTASAVIWPIAWPMLAAGAVLVMALSLTEIPATLLISPQRPPMLTPMLMTWVHMLRYDAMIEASLLLMGMVGLLGLLVAGLVFFSVKHGVPKARRLQSSGFVVLFSLLLLNGCDKSQPSAIWCETGTGPAQVVYPRAIAYKPQDDTFFIVDRMARVQHLNQRGECIGEWRMPKWALGKPVGVSVGPDGNVYVPDTHYQRVIVYSPDGKIIRQWGENGTGPGQFIFPTDIAFDRAGNIFVSEYGDNDRIQVFSPDAKFLYQIGKFGKEPGEFIRPQSMLIDGDMLYVADSCNHRLEVFKTNGTFVRVIGGVGSGLGQFRYPYGLDEDAQGHLIVCEFGNNRVQMIDKETGHGIKTWGSGGHEPGQLAYPWAVAVDRHDHVVAVDAGNNRLQVFEF